MTDPASAALVFVVGIFGPPAVTGHASDVERLLGFQQTPVLVAAVLGLAINSSARDLKSRWRFRLEIATAFLASEADGRIADQESAYGKGAKRKSQAKDGLVSYLVLLV